MKQYSFWMGAAAGLTFLIIYTCIGTRNADLTTTQQAINNLEPWNPLHCNPVMYYYLILTCAPVALVALCGLTCRIAVGLVEKVINLKNTRQL